MRLSNWTTVIRTTYRYAGCFEIIFMESLIAMKGVGMTTAHINRIATAVPQHDVHKAFIDFAANLLAEGTARNLFRRMARLSAIEHRYSFVNPIPVQDGSWGDAENVYIPGNFPATARRMVLFERFAPELAHSALDKLLLTEEQRRSITHVIVTSCTGLYAPGLDFEVVRHLGLAPSVERTMIGFMGCYAAINALKSARHIIHELEQVLSFLVFADGCAASLVSAQQKGLAIDSFLAVNIPQTSDLITWRIGGLGFDMHLSGEVPGKIGRALQESATEITRGQDPLSIELWAVHPGGRSILDAVEKGLGLRADALGCSRDILARYGNMSSATVMFVLQQIMQQAQTGQTGCAMSFGPGLTAETMLFHAA
jgi:predicted naringenin-chalcone synthase